MFFVEAVTPVVLMQRVFFVREADAKEINEKFISPVVNGEKSIEELQFFIPLLDPETGKVEYFLFKDFISGVLSAKILWTIRAIQKTSFGWLFYFFSPCNNNKTTI